VRDGDGSDDDDDDDQIKISNETRQAKYV